MLKIESVTSSGCNQGQASIDPWSAFTQCTTSDSMMSLLDCDAGTDDFINEMGYNFDHLRPLEDDESDSFIFTQSLEELFDGALAYHGIPADIIRDLPGNYVPQVAVDPRTVMPRLDTTRCVDPMLSSCTSNPMISGRSDPMISSSRYDLTKPSISKGLSNGQNVQRLTFLTTQDQSQDGIEFVQHNGQFVSEPEPVPELVEAHLVQPQPSGQDHEISEAEDEDEEEYEGEEEVTEGSGDETDSSSGEELPVMPQPTAQPHGLKLTIPSNPRGPKTAILLRPGAIKTISPQAIRTNQEHHPQQQTVSQQETVPGQQTINVNSITGIRLQNIKIVPKGQVRDHVYNNSVQGHITAQAQAQTQAHVEQQQRQILLQQQYQEEHRQKARHQNGLYHQQQLREQRRMKQKLVRLQRAQQEQHKILLQQQELILLQQQQQKEQPEEQSPQQQDEEQQQTDVTAPEADKKPRKVMRNEFGVRIYPKPSYSYSCLIALALKNSMTGALPVSEIYNFMCLHFPYFKTAPTGWKNSVRHNLSLNKCFEKIEKPAGTGNQRKGCLWKICSGKEAKMDEEILKYSRKDPDAIKDAMEYPENLPYLERGEFKYLGNGEGTESSSSGEDADGLVLVRQRGENSVTGSYDESSLDVDVDQPAYENIANDGIHMQLNISKEGTYEISPAAKRLKTLTSGVETNIVYQPVAEVRRKRPLTYIATTTAAGHFKGRKRKFKDHGTIQHR